MRFAWLPLASAEVLCWRDSVPQKARSAWSEARCLLQRNAEVPQCAWRVASRSPAQWQVSATLEHNDGICDLTWSPSGRLTAASADGTVSLWEADESNYSILENHPAPSWTLKALLGASSHAPVRDVVWSPNGELLAAGVTGSRVWRLAGNASRIHVDEADDNESLYFSVSEPNSSNETWRRRLEPPPVQGLFLEPWAMHSMLQQPDTPLAVDWSSNESALGRVLVGMREFTACSAKGNGDFVPCAEYGHERRMGATYLGLEHSAAIWHSSPAMPKRWALEATFEATRHLVVSARWSPDGKRVMTGGSDGVVRIWELKDLDFHGSGRKRWNILTERQVQREAVRAIAWSPSGEEVLTSSPQGANIWRPFNGSSWEWQGSLTATNGQKVMPNLTNTALLSPVNSPRLDTLDPDANMDWISRWSPIWVAKWSPNGQRILTGSPDGSARIWLRDASLMETWTLEATLHGHRYEVWAVAWSPDGLELVTGDQVGKVRLWRAGDKAAGALMVS